MQHTDVFNLKILDKKYSNLNTRTLYHQLHFLPMRKIFTSLIASTIFT